MNKRVYGLKLHSLFALLLSAAIAASFFGLLHQSVSRALDHYFQQGTYLARKNTQYLDKLEAYIKENNLSATDTDEIDSRINYRKYVNAIVYISRDDEIIYDSLMYNWESNTASSEMNQTAEENSSAMLDPALSNAEFFTETDEASNTNNYVGSDYGENIWFMKRDIEFADGIATVSMYGYFDELFYISAFVTEIILSVAAFCLIYLFILRKKINYIIQLDEEIKVLETGDLKYEITVQGNDELSSLADSLNQMRLALEDNIETEAVAVRSNYDLVVAVSHDLRTPLTALALYLDLIHEGKYQNEEQLYAYIEKSRAKVAQIKQMTDQLFERFYLSKEEKIVFEKPEPMRQVFEDCLSNMASFLEINGFEVEGNIKWSERKVTVSADYIGRILDNISSNIIKYADASHTVKLTVGEKDGRLLIEFSNYVKQLEAKMESTEVGVGNIKFMMEKMNGKCVVEQNGKNYAVQLLFEYSDN